MVQHGGEQECGVGHVPGTLVPDVSAAQVAAAGVSPIVRGEQTPSAPCNSPVVPQKTKKNARPLRRSPLVPPHLFHYQGAVLERRARPVFVCASFFVATYSLLPHKELRFIFPALPLFNACAVR